ncbi:META domain-containing protein [Halomonas vilamensis]|uniref:META domain-containing protein n=1 Tax=Vreelandella vilamensis TaxID=531309 RepID=A0ABU1H078_9GAMM|nr:META domain-containing protein [Halomonas vilamensis]MDR5897727.1 META domain-containing protein [Halomonas vilamensis]
MSIQWLSLLGLAVMLNACSSAPKDTSATTPSPGDTKLYGPVVEERWNLLLVGTDERLSLPETPFFRITEDGDVSGHDGCNRFTGRVQLGDNQRIAFSELASTRMACPEQESVQRVTGMLENAYRYLIDHDRLVFFGPDSRVLGGWRQAN